MKEYIQTEKECSERCAGKVCLRCGFALSPIETVDNSDRPTFWAGCTNCMIFSPGTNPKIFTIAREIQGDHQDISMDDLCSITARILYHHEADKQELILANKALGKKCTELEEARDYNAGLCEKLEQENGRLLKALHDISVIGLLSDEPDCPRSKRMREIAEGAGNV